MTAELENLIASFAAGVSDPFPRYIFRKEVLRQSPSAAENAAIPASKWYQQLAVEQRDNGSWGRFHTQDTKAPGKQHFVTTELALRRARELSLDRNDPLIKKSIALMERYLCDEETWPDTTEKHFGFLIAFKTLIAANLAIFDPLHPLLQNKRQICAANLAKAFAGGHVDETIWEQENRRSNDILLRLFTVYPIWLLQNNPFLPDDLQRLFLTWIWHRQEGIYYINNIASSSTRSLEDKYFGGWLAGLENLAEFSLFPEFMAQGNAAHLLHEIHRLMAGDVTLPPVTPIFGHYAEKWTGKNARQNDLILRILRILVKAIPMR